MRGRRMTGSKSHKRRQQESVRFSLLPLLNIVDQALARCPGFVEVTFLVPFQDRIIISLRGDR